MTVIDTDHIDGAHCVTEFCEPADEPVHPFFRGLVVAVAFTGFCAFLALVAAAA